MDTRESIIYDGRTFCDDESLESLAESSKFDGLGGLGSHFEDRLVAAALHLIHLNGDSDEATGDADSIGFYWRCGPFIAVETGAGFIDFEGFATVEDAEAKMGEIAREYDDIEGGEDTQGL